MRTALIVIASSFLMISGCGFLDNSDSNSSGTTAEIPSSALAGTWVGRATSQQVSGYVNFAIGAVLAGSSVSGNFACSNGTLVCIHTTGTISGTISGPKFTLLVSYPDGHGCGSFDGKLTSATTISGDYACSDPIANDFGTFTATKQ